MLLEFLCFTETYKNVHLNKITSVKIKVHVSKSSHEIIIVPCYHKQTQY